MGVSISLQIKPHLAAMVQQNKNKKKALSVQKSLLSGSKNNKAKVRTSVHFHLPKTKKAARDPKYPRSSVPKKAVLGKFSLIKYPLATESAMRLIEESNTIVFIVDIRANKNQIKAVVKELYNVEGTKVNTLITPAGEKKAFV